MKRPKLSARTLRIQWAVRDNLSPHYCRLIARAARAAVQNLPARVWRQRVPDGNSTQVCIVTLRPRAMAELNQRFRGKDQPTDVLSFPSPHVPGASGLGELAICWAVARTQTKAFGTTPAQEIQRVAVHGLLHLVGYDHETSRQEARRMFRLQEKILQECVSSLHSQ